MRPWTAIWKDSTGRRQSSIFQGSFDTRKAVDEFKRQNKSISLEVLIPGAHSNLYIDCADTNINHVSELAKHDHGVS